MPRDNDKNNDSRGRRDRPGGGKGRSGAARGPEKKFAKRAGKDFKGKGEGEKRPYAAKSYAAKPEGGSDAYSGVGCFDNGHGLGSRAGSDSDIWWFGLFGVPACLRPRPELLRMHL